MAGVAGLGRALGVWALLAMAGARAGSQEPGGAGGIPGIRVVVSVGVAEYDPAAPSPMAVEIVIENGSGDPVLLPAVYDGMQVALFGQGARHRWASRLFPARPVEDQRLISVAPGEARVLFHEAIGEILRVGGEEESRKWRWDWVAHPAPPPSPVHAWEGRGYEESARFWATVRIGDRECSSEAVEIAVRSH